jgi:chromosome segregation ATPase
MATVEDSPSATVPDPTWADHFAQALQQQRGKLREFLAAQGDGLQQTQSDLTAHLEEIAARLDRQRHASAGERREIEQQSSDLERRASDLELLQQELARREVALEARQQEAEATEARVKQELSRRDAALDARRQEAEAIEAKRQEELSRREGALEARRLQLEATEAKIQQEHTAAAALREGQAADTQRVAALREQWERELVDLANQRQALTAAEADTQAQRRRIAREFKDQRAAHLREIERRRAELSQRDAGQSDQLLRQLDDYARQVSLHAAETDASRARQAELAAAAESARQREAELRVQVEALQARHAEQAATVATLQAQAAEATAQAQASQGRIEEQASACAAARQQQTTAEAERRAVEETQTRLERHWNESRAKLAELHSELDMLRADRDALATQCEQLRQQRTASASHAGVDAQQIGRLEQQRDELAARLEDSDRRMAGMVQRIAELEESLDSSTGGAALGDDEETHKRYQMAMDDVRELKSRNEALEGQLRQAKAGGGPARGASGGGLDWEAEKRRILAALEEEGEDGGGDDERKTERLRIDQVVRTTQQALADKEREVHELRELLQNQSSNLGSVAVGAAALGGMLDGDAIIQEERENLKRMQREMDERLRKAEIELSLDRAKLARERTQMEEKLHAMGDHGKASDTKADGSGGDHPDKPARGRWLSRLGLKDNDKS